MTVSHSGFIVGRCRRSNIRVDVTFTARLHHGRLMSYVHVQFFTQPQQTQSLAVVCSASSNSIHEFWPPESVIHVRNYARNGVTHKDTRVPQSRGRIL